MPDIRSHRRILDTFTGPVERRLLAWIAARLPAWVTPDILTGVGILGGVVIFAGYLLSARNPAFLWLASFGFLVNWFGDSLDGTLARFRHIERPIYGFYIDHTVDAVIQILIFLGLGLSPYVRFELACLALIGYMLLSILAYIRVSVKGEFALSYGRLGPTEVRLVGVGANTLVFFVGNPTLSLLSLSLTIYDWVALGVILLLFGISLATLVNQARLLSNVDRQTPAPTSPGRGSRSRRSAKSRSRSAGLASGEKLPGRD